MLLTAGSLPTRPDQFGFEVKWDGVRALVAVDRGKVRVTTRSGRDVSVTYPELAGLAGGVGGHSVLLDGELVVFDDDGRPSFERHQRRMHVASPTPTLVEAHAVTLCLFDLLWIDGQSLIEHPLSERRRRLEELALRGPRWQTPPWSVGDSTPIGRVVDALGLEGLVAKRLDSTYRPGSRTTAWIKVKAIRTAEFVVCGWTEGEGSRAGHVGALVLGELVDGGLRYVGRVGSGLRAEDLARLQELLPGLATDVAPFDSPVPDHPHFVRPALVVEVSYGSRTADGSLRHPVFVRLHHDR
jgi:bifunctional non-homologous end joining protein LigD